MADEPVGLVRPAEEFTLELVAPAPANRTGAGLAEAVAEESFDRSTSNADYRSGRACCGSASGTTRSA